YGLPGKTFLDIEVIRWTARAPSCYIPLSRTRAVVEKRQGAPENSLKHFKRQLPGGCVLLAGMVRADQQRQARARGVRPIVAKTEGGATGNRAAVFENCKISVEGDAAQRDYYAHCSEGVDLGFEIWTTVAQFHARRFVVRRRTTRGGADEDAIQSQAVIRVYALRLRGEADGVERAIEKISGAVAGEHAAGAISPMRRGSEPDDENLGLWIAKRGHRLAPVFLIAKGAALFAGDQLAINHQPRAARAGDDTLLDDAQLAAHQKSVICAARGRRGGSSKTVRPPSCGEMARSWARIASKSA